MASQQDMIWCKACGRRTLHVQKRPTHLLHLVLTLLTFGFWIIPWSWVTLAAGRPKCTVCGKALGMLQIKR
jgi:hypothetical protein